MNEIHKKILPWLICIPVFLAVWLSFHFAFVYPYDNPRQRKPLRSQNRVGERIVFTMTTIPSRLQYVRDVIDNLLEQTIDVDAIYINLPEYSVRESTKYFIPDNLKDVDPKVKINFGVFDHGPATKIIPTLMNELEPDTMIIPIDDDVEFPPEYFEELVEYSRRFPNTVWGYHGVKVYDGQWEVVQTDSVDSVDIVETSCGVIYRRKMFRDDLEVIVDHPCRLQDDFLLNHHVAVEGYARMILPSDVDRISTKGRKDYPMKHKFEMPNPLYMVNFHKSGNAACTEVLSKSFFNHKVYCPF